MIHSEAVSGGLESVGSLLGDPTRCEILASLLDGRSFPVSELASMAHVSLATASYHLQLLAEAGWVEVEKMGRHRYHRLASGSVAEAIEVLGSLAPRNFVSQSPISEARCCYRHAAGRLGVRLRHGLLTMGWIEESGDRFVLTDMGIGELAELGGRIGKDRYGKRCLDWTERVPHIGPPLGNHLLQVMFDRRWVERGVLARELVVTRLGEAWFKSMDLDTRLP